MRSIGKCAASVAAAVLGLAASAQAASFTYSFTGTLTTGSGAFAGSTGKSVTGTFTYVDGLADAAPVAGIGSYLGAATELTVNLDGVPLTLSGSGAGNRMEVANDWAAQYDAIWFGYNGSIIWLKDDSKTAFSTEAIPTGAFGESTFATARELYFNDGLPDSFRSSIDTLARTSPALVTTPPVPTPAAAVGGLVLLAGLAAKRRRA